MRNFFNVHWKVIVAILLAVVLATVTIDTESNEVPLAARLQAHGEALASDAPRSPMRHVESSLRHYGYALYTQRAGGGAPHQHSIEATLASVAPGAMASRTFVVGARVGPGGDVGAAAVLELARAVKDLRPASGTEIRFVFFMDAVPRQTEDPGVAGQDGPGNFIAFSGSRDAAQRVRQAFTALRNDPQQLHYGLATSAHVMGSTLSGQGDGGAGATTLLITGPSFLGYPYFHTAPPERAPNEYDGLARVVDGLTRTLTAMAGAVQA